ncbi:hypothetical protein [Ruminococcus albus]|uniref:Uncharacterized protein n=1 Tax=Ruminococcus albus TaxID=1264 RepID=A0A1I1D582_RUMAL|nr:hypothetical protein [Ruminococcus albus]SFB68238.1 hypothetical protein SAMN02910406_00230 [Ruminococcus albus]
MDMLYRKKEKKSVFAVTVALFLALSAGISVFAWFAKKKDYIPVDTYRGSVRTAYFNGGNGTAPDEGTTADDYKDPDTAYPSYDNDNDTGYSSRGPYQIDNAIQLYNFAWLQYLGYFNDEDGEQTYFVLTSDIDASGLVLPPVGNEEDPFLGNFNGNGYTISGLKISNDTTELNNEWSSGKFSIPRDALDNDELKSDLEIVGLFGVIGDYTEDYTASSSAPSVSDLTIEDVAIETVSTQALAGIAAGYVNGVMDNVTVAGTSTISSSADTALSYTDKLSDYALVGYCEEPYRRNLKLETVKVNDPKIEDGSGRFGNSGQGNAWGNTIDMKAMYDRLLGEYNDLEGKTTRDYVSEDTITHNTDGTETHSPVTSPYPVTVSAGNNSSYYVRMSDETNDADASYAFIQRVDTTNFMYLYGDKEIAVVPVTGSEIWKYGSFYIKDGSTSNYLTVSGTSAVNSNSDNSASKWVFEQAGNADTYAIYTISNNSKRYLTASNGNLSISSTAFWGWTVNDDKTSISVDEYTLCYNTDQNSWELRQPPKNYICDTAENHYLSVQMNNGDPAIVDITNINNAISWDLEPVDNGYKISTLINGIRYYLTYDQDNDSLYVSNTNNPSIWYVDKSGSKGKIYVDTGNEDSNKALYYDEDIDNWIVTDYIIGDGLDWGGSMDFEALNQTVYNKTPSENNQISTQEWAVNDMSIVMSKSATTNPANLSSSENLVFRYRDNTYIPINMDEDGNALDTNTGYIVGRSGSSSAAAGVRSAAYPLKFIYRSLGGTDSSATYNDSKVEILTKSGGSWVRIKDSHNESNTVATTYGLPSTRMTVSELGFTKYEKARESLQDLLAGKNHVHGIHFDTAAIEAGVNTKISSAKILGQTLSDYYVPKSGINFKLKEAGKINFFAGSYTTNFTESNVNSDSFFSLHHVIRTSNSAFTLKEISVIYSNSGSNNEEYPYVYKYTDNTYSTGTASTELFNMSNLKNAPNLSNTLYYFEIPVNAGEYAMGAVKDSGTVKTKGAYLIYLDISANATIEGDAKIKSEGTAITATASVSSDEVQTTETLTGSTSVIKTPPTYYPLLWDENDPTKVSADNKGYIISGANNTASNPPGDIRVSKYSEDQGYYNIANSLDNGVLTDSRMYTIDSGGRKTIAAYDPKNYCKYVSSKAQMQALISNSDDNMVYGMHFMDASISMQNLLTVPSAKLGGVTYYNYEMPRNCIDLNIDYQGYINFFAGTFFNNSDDSFFSLHQIERYSEGDAEGDNIPEGKKVGDIKAINEIDSIYQRTINDTTEYVYQYVGENAPLSAEGWEMIFDLDWIKRQPSSNITRNAVYYFEIPVSPGEYALGSVYGGTGAYLLYLDVSTAKGDAVVTSEKMTVEQNIYVLPKGVQFEDDELVVYKIDVNTSGDIIYTFTSSGGTVTANQSLQPVFETSQKVTETITLHDHDGKITARKVTDNNNVSYQYAVNTQTLTDSDDNTAGVYFKQNDLINTEQVILQYHYILEERNTAENYAALEFTLEDYTVANGFTITNYNVTAETSDESVTATVDVFNSNKSYLRFFSDIYEADDEVSIPEA